MADRATHCLIGTARSWRWSLGMVLLCLGPACRMAAPAEPRADLVVVGGPIITLDAAQRRVEALAIRDGRIVVAGTAADARALAGPATRVVDLGGRTVLPAFHDAHVHPVSAGVELGQCDLNDLETEAAVLAAVQGCVVAQRGRPWVVGGGFALTVFAGGMPHRRVLDAVTGDTPTVLSSSDGHTLWVNSAALRTARIDRATADPAAGRIERDRGGEPTGVLRESAADLVTRVVPATTPAEYEAGLLRALAAMNRVGIVSFQEASARDGALAAYRAVAQQGRLTGRARLSLYADPTLGPEQVDALIATRTAMEQGGVSAGAVKIFVDGVIEAGTAALLAPYLPLKGETALPAASPHARGLPNFTDAALQALVIRLDRAGFQAHLHAIGDRGVRQGLDAIEAAARANGARDRRPHIAHVQLIDPLDVPRFAALGVVANVQALWAYADPFITDLTEPRLGPDRSRWLYPFGSLHRAGARLAGGSDWSVSSVNPLHAIQVGVTRKGLAAAAAVPPWLPDERLDLTTMLEAYTRGGAYLNFEDDRSGSLEAGKLADLIVLDHDPYAVPPETLHTLRVLWTLLEGREVWRDPQFTP